MGNPKAAHAAYLSWRRTSIQQDWNTASRKGCLYAPRKRLTDYAGITERFGDDIFDYLDKHGQMEVSWPSSVPGSGGKKTWILTQEVILKFRSCPDQCVYYDLARVLAQASPY